MEQRKGAELNRHVDTRAVSGGVTALVAVVGCALMLAGPRTGPVALAGAALAGVACLVQARLLALRAPVDGGGRTVARSFSLAAAAVGVGVLAEATLRTLAHDRPSLAPWSGVPFAVAGLVFVSLTFQGLIHGNRFRGERGDTGDWLNGLSAGLASVAATGLLLRVGEAPMFGWRELPAELWLAHTATLEVLTGTALTVLLLGGLSRKPQAIALTAALAAASIAALALGFTVSQPAAEVGVQAIWVLLVAVVGVVPWRPSASTDPHAQQDQSPVVGALVLLAISIAVLAEQGFLTDANAVTTLSAVGAAGASLGRLLQLVDSLADLTQSQRDARTDPLTGVGNRRALTVALDEALRSSGGVALLIVDLNRFKDINDQHGHAVGDEVLRATAARLAEAVGDRGLLTRLGGDEFAVVLPWSTIDDGRRLAAELARLCAQPISTAVGRVSTGASVGVAAALGAVAAPDNVVPRSGELLRRADAALYTAKRAGGGVSVFDNQADHRVRAERRRLEELRGLLSGEADEGCGRLEIHYQPQLDLWSGEVTGAEALVRWDHPSQGLLGSEVFVDLAERHGLMFDLTAWVLVDATAEAARWERAGRPLRIAVNVSTTCLVHPDLLPIVDQALAEAALDPGRLKLEITETTLMSDPERSLAVTRELGARGIAISIDDYGTGYSSLSYLNDLQATEIKLDRSFIARLAHDQRTAAIVGGTVDLAHRLGLQVVAEGVEDERTLKLLRRFRCDRSQGFLHARPMPAAEFRSWLEEYGAALADRLAAPSTSAS